MTRRTGSVRPLVLVVSFLVGSSLFGCGDSSHRAVYACAGCWLGANGGMHEGTTSTGGHFELSTYGSTSKINVDGIALELKVPRLVCALEVFGGWWGVPVVVGADGAFAKQFTNPSAGATAPSITSLLVSGVLSCDGEAHGNIVVERDDGCATETFTWDVSHEGEAAGECSG